MDTKEKQRIAAIKGRNEGQWLMTASLVIIAGVAMAFALAYTRQVMVPFVLALFIVTIVSPILDFQVLRLKFPRFIAVAITLIVVLIIISSVGFLITDVVATIVSTAPQYSEVVVVLMEQGYNKFLEISAKFENKSAEEPNKEDTVSDSNSDSSNQLKQNVIPESVTVKEKNESREIISKDGVLLLPALDHGKLQKIKPEPAKTYLMPSVRSNKKTGDSNLLELLPSTDGSVVAIPTEQALEELITTPEADPNTPVQKLLFTINIPNLIKQFRQYILSFVSNAVGATLGLISSTVFVIIFVIFLLSGRDPSVIRKGIYAEIDQKIRRYIVTKIAISAATGILVWASLHTFGLHLATMFGILAFMLNFIPSIGSVISTILPIPVAMAQVQALSQNASHQVGNIMITHNPWLFMILIIAVPGMIQFVLGSLIDPKLMGEGLNLHPVTILLTLSFWGLLWGIVGMFLAAPITAAIRVILMQFDTLKPLGELLAGRLPDGSK